MPIEARPLVLERRRLVELDEGLAQALLGKPRADAALEVGGVALPVHLRREAVLDTERLAHAPQVGVGIVDRP